MKRLFYFSALFVILGFAGCKSAAPPNASGKEWKLIEVQTANKSIIFDRKKLAKEGFNNIFTLSFADGRLSGTGASNKYSMPYEEGEESALKVSPLEGELEDPLWQPEKLRERDFFLYLQNAVKSNQSGSNLRIVSKAENGSEVTLIFTR